MLLGAVPLLLFAQPPSAVVVRPVASMYSSPSEEADVVSQAIYSTRIEIVEAKDHWARVRTPDDYTGWMPAASFLVGAKYPASERYVEVASLFAHLYVEPKVTSRQPLLTVPFETRLEVAGELSDEWMQVRLPDNRRAWIQHGDVTFERRNLSIPESVNLAKRFPGLPYTWGGTSSFGYDCSGFTQMLCRRRGASLPRDAGPQAAWEGVRAVSRDELEAGDLLFFGPSASKITHTGYYIGDGQFIHATTHGKPVVQISELADPHWTAIFVGARRIK